MVRGKFKLINSENAMIKDVTRIKFVYFMPDNGYRRDNAGLCRCVSIYSLAAFFKR